MSCASPIGHDSPSHAAARSGYLAWLILQGDIAALGRGHRR